MNIGFFHRMANTHWRNNSLDIIKINGVWLTEDQEVRGLLMLFSSCSQKSQVGERT